MLFMLLGFLVITPKVLNPSFTFFALYSAIRVDVINEMTQSEFMESHGKPRVYLCRREKTQLFGRA